MEEELFIMVKRKKLLSIGLAVILTAMTLSGCGSDSSETADSTAADTSTAGDKVTVEFFNQKTEIVDILEGLVAEYEKANSNVKIELITPSDSTTVLAARMASKDTPDIFTDWPATSTFAAEVDSGSVLNLENTGIMDNIQDSARESLKREDGEYSAPMSYNCSGIWYNKDIFEAAGISTIPATWDELIADCDKLVEAGYTPFVTSAKETDITDRQLQVFLASSFQDSYDEFKTDASAGTLDTGKAYGKELTAMAEKMVQVIGYSQKDILGTDQDSATANFANGEGALMIGGSWLYASITAANPDMNISMMAIPGDAAELTNTCASAGDMALSIAADTQVKDAAIAFVKWMTSPEIATKYAEQEGNPSCINGVDYVAEEFADLYADYVTTGKFIVNPDCYWSSGQQAAAGAAIQQLYYDLDTSVFAENIATAFNENK